jgi:hypothetical protein
MNSTEQPETSQPPSHYPKTSGNLQDLHNGGKNTNRGHLSTTRGYPRNEWTSDNKTCECRMKWLLFTPKEICQISNKNYHTTSNFTSEIHSRFFRPNTTHRLPEHRKSQLRGNVITSKINYFNVVTLNNYSPHTYQQLIHNKEFDAISHHNKITRLNSTTSNSTE